MFDTVQLVNYLASRDALLNAKIFHILVEEFLYADDSDFNTHTKKKQKNNQFKF